jgi:hypothetical protein
LALVIDTSVLYASFDGKDPHHRVCVSLLRGSREEAIVPAPVFVELDHIWGRFGTIASWGAFCDHVARGAFRIWPLEPEQLARAAALQMKYADLPLGLVDAAVFLTCEELRERKVATLDRRHFSALRTRDGRALELLPDG